MLNNIYKNSVTKMSNFKLINITATLWYKKCQNKIPNEVGEVEVLFQQQLLLYFLNQILYEESIRSVSLFKKFELSTYLNSREEIKKHGKQLRKFQTSIAVMNFLSPNCIHKVKSGKRLKKWNMSLVWNLC